MDLHLRGCSSACVPSCLLVMSVCVCVCVGVWVWAWVGACPVEVVEAVVVGV